MLIMRILGIETSCDDTAIALVETKDNQRTSFRILSNAIASQISIHQQYGGVFPMLAKREHQKNLPLVLEQVFKEHNFDPARPAIDAIALTYGPGLSPCLWAGITFAQELAKKWNLPVIPVDHIEAHLLIGLMRQSNDFLQFPPDTIFPSVALIVSGGHSQIVLMKERGKYEIIGETRDDAAGEAFDKTARILGLPYPGGPSIAKQALIPTNRTFAITLPRPMMRSKDFDFSFSGLKTAVLYDYQARTQEERESQEYIREMSSEIQQAIVDVLVSKTLKAVEQFQAKSVILGGGVAANTALRERFREKLSEGVQLLSPLPQLSTDNGAMIAIAGYFRYIKGEYPQDASTIEAKPNLRISQVC